MLPHIASRLFGTPLLVHRAKLDVILSVLGERLNIHAPSADLALPAPRTTAMAAPGIAVIPIHGTLVKRTVGLDAASGLTSYTEIASMIDSAIADPQIAGILLDVDSPGGEASGNFELARRVRDAAAVKPVWAVANDMAFSAAYAISAAANRIIISDTGGVGSIGVIALHVDQSVKDANDGYRFTAVTAGSHKNDFSPHQPMSDDAKNELQTEVDRLYGMFVDHVATMRGMSSDAVRATEAGLFFGSNAITAGLADSIGTLESAITDFSLFLSTRSRKSPQARGGSRTEAAPSQKEITMEENAVEVSAEKCAPCVDMAAGMADQVAAAKREMMDSAKAIAEMCMIAGVPEKAAEFIAAGKTEADARHALLEARAVRTESTQVSSTITTEAGTQTSDRPDASPVFAAVKKLISKE